ncbi:hypothetical protein G7Y31_05300 [Corynebacterium lizhenjunii]|uniref:Uncharacterized protein n=1 Tax=Corynebacterium lizhenjunii TaxID=2709394 RepID=A0A7T0PCU4_9CORY|nr:hypothetical protein [Corynebacterium lizhenjunii]QPK80102.1 hypothetical protein G7Y31_05300 [Corynebacterium lizhenjunii]
MPLIYFGTLSVLIGTTIHSDIMIYSSLVTILVGILRVHQTWRKESDTWI